MTRAALYGLFGSLALALAAALCACAGQADPEGTPGDFSGICWVPVTDECNADSDCERTANAMLAPLRTAAIGAPRRLISANCGTGVDCDDGGSCSCRIERDGSVSELVLGGDGCALFGRSLSCLWPSAELAVCSPGSCDCTNACARAIGLLEADDARVPPAQTRVARCVDHECRYAFAIDDRCYAGTPRLAHQTDCARSDAELLSAAESLWVAGDNFEAVPCFAL